MTPEEMEQMHEDDMRYEALEVRQAEIDANFDEFIKNNNDLAMEYIKDTDRESDFREYAREVFESCGGYD